MKKIELTPAHIAAIEAQLNGGVGYEPMDFDEIKAIDEVIVMADNLMEELEAYEESGDNLVMWFYNKYKEQQAQNV